MPWTVHYSITTSRWLPSAWPSPPLLTRSPFVQQAVARHPAFYLSTLLTLAPAYLPSFLILPHDAATLLSTLQRHGLSSLPTSLPQPVKARVVLGMWASAFLGGMSVLGLLGAGYQMRFIAPALPALALLASDAIVGWAEAGWPACECMALLLSLGAMHGLYFGVLYAPIYADVTVALPEILGSILAEPMPSGSGDGTELKAGYEMMRHFGAVLHH